MKYLGRGHKNAMCNFLQIEYALMAVSNMHHQLNDKLVEQDCLDLQILVFRVVCIEQYIQDNENICANWGIYPQLVFMLDMKQFDSDMSTNSMETLILKEKSYSCHALSQPNGNRSINQKVRSNIHLMSPILIEYLVICQK